LCYIKKGGSGGVNEVARVNIVVLCWQS